MMEEQFVTYETALLAKEKGFDENTDKCYADTKEHEYEDVWNHGDDIKVEYEPPHIVSSRYIEDYNYTRYICDAPTQSLLQKWLRENHSIHITIEYRGRYYGNVWRVSDGLTRIEQQEEYEAALEMGLLQALKLIENENE